MGVYVLQPSGSAVPFCHFGTRKTGTLKGHILSVLLSLPLSLRRIVYRNIGNIGLRAAPCVVVGRRYMQPDVTQV